MVDNSLVETAITETTPEGQSYPDVIAVAIEPEVEQNTSSNPQATLETILADIEAQPNLLPTKPK